MTTKINQFTGGAGSFQKNIKPGATAFCMSSSSWLTLQTYFNNITTLPTTTTALAAKMGTGAPTDMSDFEKLVNLYSVLQTQGTNFTSTLYPSIVTLASDVFNYAQSVPEYYAGLQELIKQLSATPAPTGTALTTIQTNLTAVLDQLASNIKPFIANAQNVSAKMNRFLSGMSSNLTTLGSDSPQPSGTGYWAYYHKEYATSSTAVQNLVSQIASETADLHQYQAQYNHDVIVAATSPTYGWLFPFGTIAAGITAGIYGAKATKAKNAIAATDTLIAGLQAQEQADMALMNDLNLVCSNIQVLHDALAAAIAILQGIEGNWTDIASDLTSLSSNLKNDFEGTCGFLLQIDFNTAMSEWANLKVEADAYRTNAFITVTN